MTLDPESGATLPENASLPFPNPGETARDVDAQAQSRVATQYRTATKLKATISLLAECFQDIEDCAVGIPSLRDPAIATGVNLDVVGELVGQSRVLTDGTVLGDGIAVGAPGGPTLYRAAIQQRILRNKSIGSGPEFVAALEYIFGATPFRFVDLGGMAVIVEFGTGAAPTSDRVALLDSGPVPRAMAVGVGRDWYDAASYFAFAEDIGAGAKGFGEIGDATKGGKFAEIF